MRCVLAEGVAELEARGGGVVEQVHLATVHQQTVDTATEAPVVGRGQLGRHPPVSTCRTRRERLVMDRA